MAEHCGYVVKITELRKHSNADRLQVATIFGNSVIVGLDTHIGDIGVYFPVDLQLSEEFCQVNDLVRRKDENGNAAGGYLEPGKRNIRAMKLRGEISDGLYLPITCLAEFTKVSDLNIGDTIDVVNGHEICCKYVPRVNNEWRAQGKKTADKVVSADSCPTFFKHVDTAQLAYNLDDFKNGDIIQLTLKMHGTSGRTGYLLHKCHCRRWYHQLFRLPGKECLYMDYVTGTRNVVLDSTHKGGFYDDNSFRLAMASKFEGKLHENETAYYEIVGWTNPNGTPIMATGDVPKEYQNQYGKTMVFSYGCNEHGEFGYSADSYPPCCDIYVYRMTMTNDEGNVVEYSPAQIKYRCEQMGVKVVPEFETFIIPEDVNPGEYVMRKVEQYYDGPDPIGKTHVREGVVARILNRNNFAVYKHKNYLFKTVSGLIVSKIDENAKIDEDILEEM